MRACRRCFLRRSCCSRCSPCSRCSWRSRLRARLRSRRSPGDRARRFWACAGSCPCSRSCASPTRSSLRPDPSCLCVSGLCASTPRASRTAPSWAPSWWPLSCGSRERRLCSRRTGCCRSGAGARRRLRSWCRWHRSSRRSCCAGAAVSRHRFPRAAPPARVPACASA